MFTNIKEKIFANKKNILKISFFIWFYFLFSDFTFATDAATWKEKDILTNFITVLDWAISIWALILGLFAYLVTLFLSPEWTSGNIFGIKDNLKDIWILISNIVYIVFAFLLIAIAFLNIIWSEKYILKSTLPKLIIWILIVPFSWFIVQFMVALSSILTMWALNLPFDMFSKYKDRMNEQNVPVDCHIDLWVLTWNHGKNSEWNWTTTNSTPSNNFFYCDNENKKNFWELLKSPMWEQNIFWMISFYVYWVVNINELDKLVTANKDVSYTKVIWDVLVKLIFDGIFVIVYIFLFIAIWLALMIRWIWLWIYMMFSPFFGLMYFFSWKTSWWGSWFFKKFNFKEFIWLTMVPVYTMLALSFWLFFLYAVGNWLTQTKWESWIYLETTWNKTNNKQDLKIWNDITLSVTWDTWTLLSSLESFWWDLLWIIWALILKIFWIVVLWWTLMVALKQSEITWEIIAPIQRFWETVGQTVQSLPQYAPILPGWQSIQSISAWAWQIKSDLESKYGYARWAELSKKLLWKDPIEISNVSDFKKLIDNEKNFENNKALTNMTKYLIDNFDEIKNNSEQRWYANKFLKWVNIKYSIQNNTSSTDLLRALKKIDYGNGKRNTLLDKGIINGSADNLQELLNYSWSTPIPNPKIDFIIQSDWKFNKSINIDGKDISSISEIKNLNIPLENLKSKLKNINLSDEDISKIIKELTP